MAYRPSELIPHTGMCILWLLQPLSVLPPMVAIYGSWLPRPLLPGISASSYSWVSPSLLASATLFAPGGCFLYRSRRPLFLLCGAITLFDPGRCLLYLESLLYSILSVAAAGAASFFATQVATFFATVDCRFLRPQLPLTSILLVTVFYASLMATAVSAPLYRFPHRF